MARVLVTGGAGFIGSHLVRALMDERHQVRVLDNLLTGKRENLPGNAELVEGDIRDDHTLREALQGADICFHLAAIVSVQECFRNWVESHHVNQSGTVSVFNAARQSGQGRAIPVIYASSAAVYGDSTDLPLKEDGRTRPISGYGADKLGSELQARVARTAYGIPTMGLRLFNVYGPRQDPRSPYSGVISRFVDRLGRGQTPVIYGDGEQTRDFVYVKDVVAFFLKAMDHVESDQQVCNVCTGQSTTINRLALLVAQVLGRSAQPEYQPARNGDVVHSVGSPGKSKRVLGLATKFDLAAGLEDMLEKV